jgi:hypothetical protein
MDLHLHVTSAFMLTEAQGPFYFRFMVPCILYIYMCVYISLVQEKSCRLWRVIVCDQETSCDEEAIAHAGLHSQRKENKKKRKKEMWMFSFTKHWWFLQTASVQMNILWTDLLIICFEDIYHYACTQRLYDRYFQTSSNLSSNCYVTVKHSKLRANIILLSLYIFGYMFRLTPSSGQDKHSPTIYCYCASSKWLSRLMGSHCVTIKLYIC